MRQNAARKQCTTTPQAQGKATRPSQKQPDTQREGPVKLKIYWARAPHGCNRGGREGSNHKTTNRQRRAQVQRGRQTENTETKHAEQRHTSKHGKKDSKDTQKRTQAKGRTRNNPEARKAQPSRGVRQGVDQKRGMQYAPTKPQGR